MKEGLCKDTKYTFGGDKCIKLAVVIGTGEQAHRYTHVKVYKLYTLRIRSLLYVNYTSIKLCKYVQNDTLTELGLTKKFRRSYENKGV